MKTESKNLKQNYNSKLEAPLTLGFKFWFCIFQFVVLAFCLPASPAVAQIPSEQLDPTNLLMAYLAQNSQKANTLNVPTQATELQPTQQEDAQTTLDHTGTAPANFAAQADQKLPQDSLLGSANPNSLLARQLWQDRIAVLKSEGDTKNKTELQQIIEQIRSVEFKPKQETPEPIIVIEPLPAPINVLTKPNETSSVSETPVEPREKETKSKLPYEPVTDQTLQMLENLSQHPDQLDDPFALAEILFLSGRLKEAAAFYQETLNRKSPDEADSAWHRAWILFQIGNCLRNEDLDTAKKIYRQLITEYPDSPWTELARTQDKLIDWFQKDKPRTLIAENRL